MNVKVIITVVVIALVGLATGVGVRALMKNKQSASDQAVDGNNDDLDLPGGNGQFAWGITVLPFPFPTYTEDFTRTQMAEAKKLGVNYIRLDYTPANPKAAEMAVEAALQNSLKVVLVIPFGPKDIFTDKNLKSNAAAYVSDVAKKFKGKVAVYQLATEVASVALGNDAGAHGIELKDYPADKLKAVTEWVKAATEAIKATDPSAKRLVNDQWVHTGFFDNYFSQGGDFDLLGWNWFSDMGTSMEKVTIDANKKQTYELLAKLEKYHKPIWLTEVNRRLGSQSGKEKDQADFIVTMAKYAAKVPAIKGFFVFNLLEDQVAPVQERGYSIVTATDTGKGQKITGQKPAFKAYQNVIKANR